MQYGVVFFGGGGGLYTNTMHVSQKKCFVSTVYLHVVRWLPEVVWDSLPEGKAENKLEWFWLEIERFVTAEIEWNWDRPGVIFTHVYLFVCQNPPIHRVLWRVHSQPATHPPTDHNPQPQPLSPSSYPTGRGNAQKTETPRESTLHPPSFLLLCGGTHSIARAVIGRTGYLRSYGCCCCYYYYCYYDDLTLTPGPHTR